MMRVFGPLGPVFTRGVHVGSEIAFHRGPPSLGVHAQAVFQPEACPQRRRPPPRLDAAFPCSASTSRTWPDAWLAGGQQGALRNLFPPATVRSESSDRNRL